MSASSRSRELNPVASTNSTRVVKAIAATTAMRVADDLRRRILHGDFVPGQRLKIDDLASLCAVSHMPVRAALQEL